MFFLAILRDFFSFVVSIFIVHDLTVLIRKTTTVCYKDMNVIEHVYVEHQILIALPVDLHKLLM